jgi:hypothetical protein
MASTLETIRTNLKNALEEAPGLSAYATVPSQVNTPAVVVAPEGIEYEVDFDGGATYTLPVQFLASLGDWATAQRTLDAYVSHDGSAVAALYDTEGFEVRVLRLESYGLTEFAGTNYLGVQLVVEVLA